MKAKLLLVVILALFLGASTAFAQHTGGGSGGNSSTLLTPAIIGSDATSSTTKGALTAFEIANGPGATMLDTSETAQTFTALAGNNMVSGSLINTTFRPSANWSAPAVNVAGIWNETNLSGGTTTGWIVYGIWDELIVSSSGNLGSAAYGIAAQAINQANNITIPQLVAVYAPVANEVATGVNIPQMIGVQAQPSGGGTGTIGEMISFYANPTATANTLTVTNVEGVRITDITGTIVPTNDYGILIDNIAKGGTNNYAIFTGTGKVVLGDTSIRLGGLDAAAPVSPTLSVQSATATNTNQAAGTWTLAGSLGTGNAIIGPINRTTGAMSPTSGTTVQSAVVRVGEGWSKVLSNNVTTTMTSLTLASNTVAQVWIHYGVEVFNGTDLQFEVGDVACGAANKGGVVSVNTCTKGTALDHQTTVGTLAVTFTITAASPALVQVNANSSLTPSAGYPRITYSVYNYGQQQVTEQ